MRLYGPKLDALPHFLAVHLLTQSVARLLTYLLTDCPQLNPDDAYALPSLREYCITNTTYRRVPSSIPPDPPLRKCPEKAVRSGILPGTVLVLGTLLDTQNVISV